MHRKICCLCSLVCFFVLANGGAVGARIHDLTHLPLAFEPTPSDPLTFAARGDGYAMKVNANSVKLWLGRQQRNLGWSLEGTRPGIVAPTTYGLPGHVNYLIGRDPAKWRVNVPTYSRIVFSGVYPGIDEIFYGSQRELEHDYVISPKADAGRIRFRMTGPQILLDNGEVVVRDKDHEFRLRRPSAYQMDASGVRREVAAAYVRHSDGSFGFQLGAYDHSRPLTIDPVLSYSTYLGGTASDNGQAIAIDSHGSAYVTGLTFSTDFPVTNGAIQSACRSCSPAPDVFVSKLNAAGTALAYSTYIGGSDYDQPSKIAVDGNGNAVVGGHTSSPDFPLLNANPTWGVLPSVGPRSHGFVFSLDPTGTAFNFSTYIAGSGSESVAGVLTDSAGNVFALGSTNSPDFPVTPGTVAAPTPGYSLDDIFVMKLAPAGTLTFAALIGPTKNSSSPWANSLFPTGLAIDSNENIFITGWASDGFPTTAGSYQPSFKGNPNSQTYNAFVAKLDPAATQILAATYLGGNSQDKANAIAVDSAGNAYITGTANSTDFPVTAGAFQTSLGTSCCASFVAKFAPSLDQLEYSTFLKGLNSTGYTNALSVAVDSSGQAVVTGETQAADFPLFNPLVAQPAAWQFGSSVTAFVTRFNAAGSGVTFSTYYGGSTGSHGMGVALDTSGDAYITGTTNDIDLPTTAGAFQRSVPAPAQFATPSHAFIAKFAVSAPGPSLCSSAISVNFSYVRIGTVSQPKTINLTNCGNAPLTVTSVLGTVGTDFAETDNCTSGPISSGNTCTMRVTFKPTAEVFRSATLLISSNTGITTRVVLAGNGAQPHLGVSAGPITFDSMLVGVTTPVSHFVFLSNTSMVTLTFTSIATSGDFAQTNNCTPTLFPSQSCLVSLTFTPTAAGPRSGTLTVISDDPNGPATATLTGTGFAAYPSPTITSITPDNASVASSGVHLSVFGTNFFPASVIEINGVAHATTYQGSTFLSTDLTADDVAKMSEQQVTVTTPAPGGGTASPSVLTVYLSLRITATGLVFDPYSRQLFAVVRSGATNYANSVVPINPFTGSMGTSVVVGNDPARTVISNDGRYLYIALDGDHAVRRYDIGLAKADIQIEMPSNPTFGQMRAFDMAVVPNDSHSFLASLQQSGVSPGEGGLALFKDGTMKTLVANDYPTYASVDRVRFMADPAVAWAGGYGSGLMQFSLGTSGLSLVSRDTNSPIGASFESDGAYLYSTSGQVYDPIHRSSIGKYSVPSAQTVVPDTGLRRTFFYGFDGLSAYDQSSFAQLDTVAFGHSSGNNTLLRWGPDGFALLMLDIFGDHSKDSIALFRSRLARPNAATTLTPSLGSTSPAAQPVGSGNFLMTVTGTNFVAGAVATWNSTELTTKFIDSTTLLAYVANSDIGQVGTVQVSVKNPNGSSSATTNFQVTSNVSLSASSVSLGTQLLGTSPSGQVVTLTNTGITPLTITAITASTGFTQTNDCSSLAVSTACHATVYFQPTAPGPATGNLTIVVSDGETLTITLSANATDFVVDASSGPATSATVEAGQSATFNLAASPVSGFTGNVALNCSGAPALAQCVVSPTSVTVGSEPAAFTVTFTTTAPTAGLQVPSLPPAPPNGKTIFWVVTAAVAAMGLLPKPRVRPAFAFVLLCVATMPGCGGGGGTTSPPNSKPGTQAGPYVLTVTATAQGVSRQAVLNVTVQ